MRPIRRRTRSWMARSASTLAVKPGLFLFSTANVDQGPHVGANMTNVGRRLMMPSMWREKSISPNTSLGFAATRSIGGIATNPAPIACAFKVPLGPSKTDKKSAFGPLTQKSMSLGEHLDRSSSYAQKSARATSQAAADGPNAFAASVRTSDMFCIPGMRRDKI